MKLLFSILVLCACVHISVAKTINVADHGVVPGKDSTLSLVRLIDGVQGKKNVTLVFPKGRYDFYPENARELHRAVSNHDNSLKRMIFAFFGNRNLVVDGGGSEFVFHGRVSPFVLDGVDGVTLKNFSIDWARAFHNELKVVESNAQDGSFVVEIDPERYPYSIKYDEIFFKYYDWEDPFGDNIVFDPATRSPIYMTRNYSVPYNKPVKASHAGKNRVKLVTSVKEPPPVGSVLIVYGVNPTSRLCPAVHAANCRDVVVRDVNVYAAGGMGFITERTENVRLNRFNVLSTDDRLISTRADATHFVGCKGEIVIENCVLKHMLDDSANVHGAYVRVDEYLGERRFLCAISHPQQWGLVFAEPGDDVALLSRTTVLPFYRTVVKHVEILNEQRFIVEVRDLPDDLPEGPLSMENLTWYPDFTMRNNTVTENRARSVLITTKGRVLVENNYFSSQMKGILIEGDNNYWYESGAVEDVMIRNNVFENIGYEGGPRGYALYASPLFNKTQHMGEGRYHRNIRFIGNTVRSFNGQFVLARSVDGLSVKGNKFEFSKDYEPVEEVPAIDLEYCANVEIDGNTCEGFQLPLKVRASKDTEEVQVAPEQGFLLQKQ